CCAPEHAPQAAPAPASAPRRGFEGLSGDSAALAGEAEKEVLRGHCQVGSRGNLTRCLHLCPLPRCTVATASHPRSSATGLAVPALFAQPAGRGGTAGRALT